MKTEEQLVIEQLAIEIAQLKIDLAYLKIQNNSLNQALEIQENETKEKK